MNLSRSHLRFGFTTLALWLSFGAVLEGFLGFKQPSYLLDPLRRELWSLAHFHGALLALINLVYAPHAGELRRASLALRAGSIFLPLGFFGGGIAHPEGDPSAAIVLVPIGAALVIATMTIQAIKNWR